jgi:hypothetical protein
VNLNRLLLEDAYPRDLAQNRRAAYLLMAFQKVSSLNRDSTAD